jgi:polyhydroxyalkanoate synthesis regulator phasin
MISVNIEPADNGIIKYVVDDNINGAGEEYVSRVVYNLEKDHKRSNLKDFIQDLILDLGLETGNALEKHVLSVKTEWGSKYNPSVEELKERIGLLEEEIEKLSAKLK